MPPPIIEWSAPEHFHIDKSSDWYWAVGIITLTCTALAIIFGQIIFGIFILAGMFALTLHAARKPRIVRMAINDRGIIIDNVLYPFVALDSFWIEHEMLPPKALIRSRKTFMPYISVLIEEVDPEDVRSVLLQYIAETEHSEPFSQKLLETLGF